jgi:hypothetical protein
MKNWSLLAGVLMGGIALGAAPGVLGQQATVAPVAKTPPSTPSAGKTPVPKTSAKKDDSVCKGLEEKSCRSNSECVWIAATKRQDGKEVRAYCRKKAGGSAKKTKQTATAAKSAQPPASTTGQPTTTPQAKGATSGASGSTQKKQP